MIETTKSSVPSANYRQSLDILSLGLNGSRTPSFILVRKHTSLSSHIGLAIPVKNMAELAEGFENGTSYASLQESIVKTRMQPQPDDYGFREEPRAGLAYLDFQNAFCFDQDNMVDAGYVTQVEGKTNEDEYGRIQLLINKLMQRPEEIMHKAFAQFLGTAEPENITIKPNSVWDVLLKNRGTPNMAVADFLSHLEATRIRVQALMDLHRIPVNVAKQLLVDYMKADDKFHGAGSFKLSNHYETLTRSLPDAAFKEGGEFDRLQKRDDLKKEMALDEDFVYSDYNRPNFTSLHRANTSGALKVLLKAGYRYLEDVLSDCAHGTIWHKLDFEDEVEAAKVTKRLSALYFASFRQALPPAAEQPIDAPEIEETIVEIQPVSIEEPVENSAPEMEEAAPVEQEMLPDLTEKPGAIAYVDFNSWLEKLPAPESAVIDSQNGSETEETIEETPEPENITDNDKLDISIDAAIASGLLQSEEDFDICGLLSHPVSPAAPKTLREIFELTKDNPQGLKKLFYGVGPVVSAEIAGHVARLVDTHPQDPLADMTLQTAINNGYFAQNDNEVIDYAAFLSEPKGGEGDISLRDLYNMVAENPVALAGKFESVGPGISKRLAAKIIDVVEQGIKVPALS
ncbi:MAG: hypothetical protein DI586_02580 [Micavibrio aeruginosavorus]|uniref:Uncharacterized protein n=1 Tax=Micavibrio aeruginosavorus TaxID=349221 RepID=A0A2W5HT65_9BACT|nr:MAG: hypothetical protein DI586_02580 [Micavibrio aeruginosavorus]